MKNNNYTIARTKNNGEITFINYNEMNGYRITPKNTVKYPGIEVNSLLLVKPSFIEKVLKRKNKIKLNHYLNYIIEQSDDDDSDYRAILDNIARYKGIIEYKYRKYLDDKYINLLNKKIDLLEKKIKTRLIYKEIDLENKRINNKEIRGKSR